LNVDAGPLSVGVQEGELIIPCCKFRALEARMGLFGIRFESKSLRRKRSLRRENRWDDFFKNGPRVSDDFMTEREQPHAEDRKRHIEATEQIGTQAPG
jgi:hypothetical protein